MEGRPRVRPIMCGAALQVSKGATLHVSKGASLQRSMHLLLTLNLARVGSWWKRFDILEDVEIVIPSPLERVQHPPPGFFAIMEGYQKAGFRVPPSDDVIVVFQFCGVPVTQFTLAGLKRIM